MKLIKKLSVFVLGTAFTVVVLAAVPWSVAALPYGTSAGGRACSIGGCYEKSAADNAFVSSPVPPEAAASWASANARIGSVGASAFASGLFGFAEAGASFFDTLTVTGKSGDLARFEIGMMRVDVFALEAGIGGGSAGITSHVMVNSSYDSRFGASEVYPGPGYPQVPISSLVLPRPFVYEAFVGQKFVLSEEVDVYAIPGFTYYAPYTFPSHATDPWLVFIDPLTPGDGYVSESGITYPSGPTTSVPEPGTLLLLGSGMMGLVIWRNRFGWRHG